METHISCAIHRIEAGLQILRLRSMRGRHSIARPRCTSAGSKINLNLLKESLEALASWRLMPMIRAFAVCCLQSEPTRIRFVWNELWSPSILDIVASRKKHISFVFYITRYEDEIRKRLYFGSWLFHQRFNIRFKTKFRVLKPYGFNFGWIVIYLVDNFMHVKT